MGILFFTKPSEGSNTVFFSTHVKGLVYSFLKDRDKHIAALLYHFLAKTLAPKLRSQLLNSKLIFNFFLKNQVPA